MPAALLGLLLLLTFLTHNTCCHATLLEDALTDAAQSTYAITVDHLQSFSFKPNITVSDLKYAYRSFLQEAFREYESLAIHGRAVTITMQLDSIPVAPRLFYISEAFGSASNYRVQLVPYPTSFSSRADINPSTAVLPVDGRWSDFASNTINDIRAYTSSKNLRKQHHWHYRTDLFAAHNISTPETWEDLIAAAKKLNGTDIDGDGKGDNSVCFNSLPHCMSPYVIYSIVGSMLQHQGPAQGVLFEPETMEPLVLNAAMRRALEIYAKLKSFTGSHYSSCWPYSRNLHSGRCAITFALDQFQFSIIAAASNVKGRLGTMLGPGSSLVLDRKLDKLVPCTPNLCPNALPSHRDASTLVNYANLISVMHMAYLPATQMNPDAPPVLSSFASFLDTVETEYSHAFLLGIGAEFSPACIGCNHTMTTADAFTNLTSNSTAAIGVPSASTHSLSNMLSSLSLAAATQSGTDLKVYPNNLVAMGYNIDDTLRYLRVCLTVIRSPNTVLADMSVPGAAYFRLALSSAANDASNTDADLGAIMSELDRKYRLVAGAMNDTGQFQHLYWAAIGYSPSATVQSPSKRREQSLSRIGEGTAGIIAAVVVVVVTVSAMLLYAARMYMTGRTLRGNTLPPGTGPGTTLLVTDVQDSTGLWEYLPMPVMEEVMAVHHKVIRALLTQHYGYESATEGDSFILAFRSAADAVAYAVATQHLLLQANWPDELLANHALAAPCYARTLLTNLDAKLSHTVRSLQCASCAAPGPSKLAHSKSFISPAHQGTSLQLCAQRTLSRVSSMCCTQQQRGKGLGTTIYSQTAVDFALGDAMITTSTLALSAAPGGLGGPKRLGTCSFGWAISQAWELNEADGQHLNLSASRSLDIPSSGCRNLIWRGLRVRMGLHSGLSDPSLISTNPTSRRTQYSGSFAATAKAICDAGHGGQILLSHTAFEQLLQSTNQQACSLQMGQHILANADEEAMPIYQTVVPTLAARLQMFPPLRTKQLVSEGVLSATVGTAAIVFMQATGVQTLLSWDADITRAALKQYHELVQRQLMNHGGYLAELVDGLALVAFQQPADAIVWALWVHNAMLVAEWSEELLQHELCEPVITTMALEREDGEMLEVQKVSMRGLRLKVGIAMGEVIDYVNTTTGHIMYRGRVMNWAARVSNLASNGQVLCTDQAWDLAAPLASGVRAVRAGLHMLRGVRDPITLYSCTYTLTKSTSRASGLERSKPAQGLSPVTMSPRITTEQ